MKPSRAEAAKQHDLAVENIMREIRWWKYKLARTVELRSKPPWAGLRDQVVLVNRIREYQGQITRWETKLERANTMFRSPITPPGDTCLDNPENS